MATRFVSLLAPGLKLVNTEYRNPEAESGHALHDQQIQGLTGSGDACISHWIGMMLNDSGVFVILGATEPEEIGRLTDVVENED